MSKKEFDCHFHIDVNHAWSGSAYFVNTDRTRTYMITVAAMPEGKANTSKADIKNTLMTREKEMADEGWIRVDREEMRALDNKLRTVKKVH